MLSMHTYTSDCMIMVTLFPGKNLQRQGHWTIICSGEHHVRNSVELLDRDDICCNQSVFVCMKLRSVEMSHVIVSEIDASN